MQRGALGKGVPEMGSLPRSPPALGRTGTGGRWPGRHLQASPRAPNGLYRSGSWRDLGVAPEAGPELCVPAHGKAQVAWAETAGAQRGASRRQGAEPQRTAQRVSAGQRARGAPVQEASQAPCPAGPRSVADAWKSGGTGGRAGAQSGKAWGLLLMSPAPTAWGSEGFQLRLLTEGMSPFHRLED